MLCFHFIPAQIKYVLENKKISVQAAELQEENSRTSIIRASNRPSSQQVRFSCPADVTLPSTSTNSLEMMALDEKFLRNSKVVKGVASDLASGASAAATSDRATVCPAIKSESVTPPTASIASPVPPPPLPPRTGSVALDRVKPFQTGNYTTFSPDDNSSTDSEPVVILPLPKRRRTSFFFGTKK